MATDKTKFLRDWREVVQEKLNKLQSAIDSFNTDEDKKDIKENIIPILEELVDKTLDARLRGEWLELLQTQTKASGTWVKDLAHWEYQLAIYTNMLTEIDRLLD